MELSAAETNAQPEGTELQRSIMGGNKPLHRFMKGQPKVIGIILLMMGSSLFILSLPLHEVNLHKMGFLVQPGLWLGPTFIACGILYILAEYNPTKKTVTASLAVSIVALLAALWVSLLTVLPTLLNAFNPYNPYRADYLVCCLYVVFEVYIFVAVPILIVMSTLAGVSLRSTHSQAQLMMTQSQLPTK